MLEKTPESPLDSKEIKPVSLKGKQPWILFARTDAEAPVLWLPDTNRKLWSQKKKEEVEEIPAHPMNASVGVHSYELAVR